MTSPSQTALRLRLSESKESREFRDSIPRLPARGRVSFGDSPIQRSRSAPKGALIASQEVALQVRASASPASTSLAKLQMERWNLLEQVEGLESQVATRDMLIDENNKLRDELNEVESELNRVRCRYQEMADKLTEYITKEKIDRKSMESQIFQSKRQVDSITQDNTRLENEVSNLRDELSRIKSSLSSSIDRGVHERQMSDIQNENAHLRTLLEDTVPRAMLLRIETELSEKLSAVTHNSIHLKELQMSKTRITAELEDLCQQNAKKSETIEELEYSIEAHRDQLAQLKAEAVEIIDEKDLELQKYKATAEKEICLIQSELESTKDTVTGLENKLKKKALELHESRNETKLTLESLTRLKSIVGRFTRHFRDELDRIRSTLQLEKRSMMQCFSTHLDTLISSQDNYYKGVLREVESMADFNVSQTDSARTGSGRLLDAIASLKEVLIETRDENKLQKAELNERMSDNEALKARIREKDKLIDGLIMRMSKQEQDRRNENAAIVKLRDSIRAAEHSLSSGKVRHEKALSESMQLHMSRSNELAVD